MRAHCVCAIAARATQATTTETVSGEVGLLQVPPPWAGDRESAAAAGVRAGGRRRGSFVRASSARASRCITRRL
eukprot:5705110-Prymnesium_polylepis.1